MGKNSIVLDSSRDKRREIIVDGVFDIETEDWSKFVVGGCYNANERSYREFGWRKESDMANYLLTSTGCWWAHNGGGFDFKWLLDFILASDTECKISSAGGTIISIDIANGRIERRGGREVKGLKLFDSYALTKITLGELSKVCDVRKSETGLICRCGDYCGGYCSIRRNMPAADYSKLKEYLRIDCISLFESLTKFQEFAEREDLDLGATVGGSAWRHAQRFLSLPDSDLSPSDHLFCREGYYGGRVQQFKRYSAAGWEFDVSAMYPSRLAYCKVPVGKGERTWGKACEGAYRDGMPGIFSAVVDVPLDRYIPPLPLRTKDRVTYPTGDFRGVWPAPELRYAEETGCNVQILEGVVWPREEIVFRPWIDKLFKMRSGAEGGKSGPLGTFVKFYMNSLTGKFGAKPLVEQVYINPVNLRPCRCRGTCDGECGCLIPLDAKGHVRISKRFRIDACAHVEWSAYLTSEARVEWHRQAMSNGDGGHSIVQGDTDSLFTEKILTRNVGSNLGEWECKGEYRKLRCYAPKVYTFDRDEKIKLKAKGVPLKKMVGAAQDVEQIRTRRSLEAIERKQRLSRPGIIGFKKGAKDGKFFQKFETVRSVGGGYGDRYYNAETGETNPIPTTENCESFNEAASYDEVD